MRTFLQLPILLGANIMLAALWLVVLMASSTGVGQVP